MTSPKGNSDYCFPETLDVPRGFANTQLQKSTVLQEVKNVKKKLKEMNESFFVTIKIYH